MMRAKSYWLVIFLTILSLCSGTTWAQTTQDSGTVRFANRDIVTLQATILEQTPQDRQEQITERLNSLSGETLLKPLGNEPYRFHDLTGIAITHQGYPIIVIFSDDIPPDGPPLNIVAAQVKERLQEAMLASYEQENMVSNSIGVGLSILATIIFVAALWLVQRGWQFVFKKLNKRTSLLTSKKILSWHTLLIIVERYLLKGISIIIGFILGYAWLTFVLIQFPYTEPWGQQLGNSILGLVEQFSDGILDALPGVVTIIAILIVARLVHHFLNFIFDGVLRKNIMLPGLHPETVGATRRLALVALWLFVLIVAYPYLPGSNSDVFKGVSVFFGLMLTLGSAGLVNQAMSGLVLVYSRALRLGDMVKVADNVEGVVIELGPLSTKIRNRLDQEITLPNSVLISSKIVNCTHLTDGKGETIATSIAISYEVPWRQVHAMLELAAKRTLQLRQDFQPIVRQVALQNFNVEYEVITHLADGYNPLDALSALHASIQDVFNEFGVQIMSPSFDAQPANPQLVPKENWYLEPATKPKET